MARKKIGKGQQKKSKFWLMRMRQIQLLYIYLSYLQQNLPFWWKIAFSVNLRSIWCYGSQKSDLTVKNGIF